MHALVCLALRWSCGGVGGKDGSLWKGWESVRRVGVCGKVGRPNLNLHPRIKICITRVDQNRMYTPYMTVYLVIPLPETPYVYIWFWPPYVKLKNARPCVMCVRSSSSSLLAHKTTRNRARASQIEGRGGREMVCVHVQVCNYLSVCFCMCACVSVCVRKYKFASSCVRVCVSVHVRVCENMHIPGWSSPGPSQSSSSSCTC